MAVSPPICARQLLRVAVLTAAPLFSFAQTPLTGQQTTLPPALLVPQGSPLDRDRPFQQIPTAPGLPDQALPPAGTFAPGASVRIASAVVNGSTIYKQTDLDAITKGLVGATVPMSQVEAARQALLARYREDGLPADHGVDCAGPQRQPAVLGRRRLHRRRAAAGRYRAGRHAGVALPRTASGTSARSGSRRWSGTCCLPTTCRA